MRIVDIDVVFVTVGVARKEGHAGGWCWSIGFVGRDREWVCWSGGGGAGGCERKVE